MYAHTCVFAYNKSRGTSVSKTPSISRKTPGDAIDNYGSVQYTPHHCADK